MLSYNSYPIPESKKVLMKERKAVLKRMRKPKQDEYYNPDAALVAPPVVLDPDVMPKGWKPRG